MKISIKEMALYLVGMLVVAGIYDSANASAYVKTLNDQQIESLYQTLNSSNLRFSNRPVEWSSGK